MESQKQMIQIHQVEQGTNEWQELRSGLYTGSNAIKLLQNAGSIKIVAGVASAYSLTEITGFTGNFYTKRGHILEDEAIELYEAIKKVKVLRHGFITNSSFLTCGFSPDGMTEDRVLEVKCFNMVKHMQIYNGAIPSEILAQIHFGMLITEKKLAQLIIYNPEIEEHKLSFKVIDIPYNKNIANNFKRILKPKKVAV